MARSARMTDTLVKQIIIVAVLLLILAALAVSYLLLTAAPERQGAAGERDREFLFSIYGFEGDLLRRPTGVGMDDQGNIYIADTGKRRIVVFDRNKRFQRVYGEAGKGELLLWDPIDVAVAADGRSWVVDRSQSKIVEYDVTGVATKEVITPEPPTQITIKDDLMFVCVDSGVLIADLDMNLLTGYVARGKEPGQFDRPGGVAVGEDGTLYVADSLNYRVQAISSSGQPLWQYGKPIPPDQAIQFDSEERKFGLPANIALDENGLLYVVDGVDSEIVVLDTDGNYIETIGDVGGADGMFYYPDGIAYANGRLAIADKFNDRVEVFRVPLPPGQAWRAYVPYAVVLLLLPLLILPFLRRRRRYVVTPEFVGAIAADEERDRIADSLKRVYATEAVAEAGSAIEDLKLKWKAHDFKDEDVAKVVERFGVPEELAQALVIAANMRGKRVLVTDDPQAREAAEQLKVPVVTLEEIKRALKAEAAAKKGATPPTGGGPEAPGALGEQATGEDAGAADADSADDAEGTE